jgi:hypothetical protein
MSHVISTRRFASVLACAAIAATGVAVIGTPASAVVGITASSFTVTKVAPQKVASLTADLPVTITGTGFDPSNVTRVDLSVTAQACLNVPFVVLSSTTIIAKTVAGCATTVATSVGETIFVYQTYTDQSNYVGRSFTGTSTTNGLFFIAAQAFPSDAAATPKAYLANSDALANATPAAASKKVALSTAGGQTIKVVGSGYATGLTAKLGGKALTSLVIAAGGGSFTAKTSAMTAGALSLELTANGVSKTFTTQLVAALTTSVTSVTPTSIAVGSAGTVTINGTNFGTVTGNITAKICNVTATVLTATATKITVTLPTVENLAAGVGVGNYEGSCGVTVSVATAGVAVANPISATSHISIVNS